MIEFIHHTFSAILSVVSIIGNMAVVIDKGLVSYCLLANCVNILLCRQAALEAEKARSVRLAALPPPPKDPLDSVEPLKCT